MNLHPQQKAKQIKCMYKNRIYTKRNNKQKH